MPRRVQSAGTSFGIRVGFIESYKGADKSLARPTSRCILFDGENISLDASLFIYINNTNISPIMIPIHKGGDRLLVTNYRPVSLTSVVCKQMEHIIASYLMQVWDKNDWLYEGQHGFTPGYSCESQLITVCQDIADSIDNGGRVDAIIIDISKAFDLFPHGRLLTKIANSGVDSRVVVWIREFL